MMTKARKTKSRVAVITTEPLPMELPPGELDVIPALQRAGAAVESISWHEEIRLLNAFDHVVIRTPWDYPTFPDAFTRFLDGLSDVDAVVHNHPRVLQWNAHKSYLLELAETAPVIETILVRKGERLDVSACIQQRGWVHGAIRKPAIGGGAVDTYVVQKGAAASTAAEDTLVQPYWPEIATKGELSLIYLGGELSHVVKKVPKSGDFRVQSEHGGSVQALASPPGDSADAAEIVLRAAARVCGEDAAGKGALTYARVDGVMTDDGFRLMELEVIEPELFLEWDPGAADRLAHAVLSRA